MLDQDVGLVRPGRIFREVQILTSIAATVTFNQSDAFNLPDQPIKCVFKLWEV
jgi:hypothetical protein